MFILLRNANSIFNFFLIIFIGTLCTYGCEKKQTNNIPRPKYFPNSNPLYFDSVTKDQIDLGRLLFFDNRLSSTNKISCKSCHIPSMAFTDGEVKGVGILGRHSRNNSSTLINIGYSPTFMFDMRAHNLNIQPMIPISDSNEMNMSLYDIVPKLKDEKELQNLSQKAYGKSIDPMVIAHSLAAFMKSLVYATTKYDKFLETGDSSVFSEQEKRGMELFFGKGTCNSCHTAPLFSDYNHRDLNVESRTSENIGKYGATLDIQDKYRFKTPILRNIAVTSPYFHNGSVIDLKDAIRYHVSQERASRDFNPPKLNEEDIENIYAFLQTLTDERYIKK